MYVLLFTSICVWQAENKGPGMSFQVLWLSAHQPTVQATAGTVNLQKLEFCLRGGSVLHVCLCSWNLSIYLKSSDPHREFWLSLESGARGRKAWCCFIFTLPCSIQEKSGYKGRSWAGTWVKMGEGGCSNPQPPASLFKKCLIDGDSSKVLSD